MSKVKFEVCLQSADDVHAAHAGGADRVELCSALVEGGLTPSLGSIAASREIPIELRVMIRPRGGDFVYTSRELVAMERDIEVCRDLGADGVVFGMLTPDGGVAEAQVQRLVRAAGPLSVTFHRAFDVCRDPFAALDRLRDLGVTTVLTSGQRATVPEGAALIARLVEHAGADITILPGCGITPENVQEVLTVTGATEFHATAFELHQSSMVHRNPEVYMGVPGLPEYEREVVTADQVRRYLNQIKVS
ncbi:copper homeostasis protein CutC [Lewinella sp. IMCC34183]|uniref:copper homeostasis protein CutC n=1 Tax=Lewinella sp. IMCC34183 TaxID=2248762 RepID=UPI000E242636|nr:copper homeostasis protein CutC [Lewinella sp. IMCC34183]